MSSDLLEGPALERSLTHIANSAEGWLSFAREQIPMQIGQQGSKVKKWQRRAKDDVGAFPRCLVERVFDELMVDRRGGRKGFPPVLRKNAVRRGTQTELERRGTMSAWSPF